MGNTKYIRTKDGIIDISNLKIDTKYNCYVDEQDVFQYPLNKYREADTIEELVDEFIVMSGYSLRHYTFKTLRNAIKHSKLFPFEVMYIYGAIWTDKGLIYVAKMNDEGKLELC